RPDRLRRRGDVHRRGRAPSIGQLSRKVTGTTMVGILLMTHAPLGQAFIAAVAHVFRGPTERIEAIDVTADQDTNEVNGLAKDAIRRLDEGDGVLVITDIKGGTQSNCCNAL